MKPTITVMLLVLVLGGCSQKCKPGSRQECDCPEGYWLGKQVCNLNGNSWGECKCKEEPADLYEEYDEPACGESDESACGNPASPENIAAMIAMGEIDYDPETGELSTPVPKAYIGVYLENVAPEKAEKLGLDTSVGVMVTSVKDDSPADKAGLMAEDVILRVGDAETDDYSQATKEFSSKEPGDEVEFEIIRKGEKKTVVVTFEKRPDDS